MKTTQGYALRWMQKATVTVERGLCFLFGIVQTINMIQRTQLTVEIHCELFQEAISWVEHHPMDSGVYAVAYFALALSRLNQRFAGLDALPLHDACFEHVETLFDDVELHQRVVPLLWVLYHHGQSALH